MSSGDRLAGWGTVRPSMQPHFVRLADDDIARLRGGALLSFQLPDLLLTAEQVNAAESGDQPWATVSGMREQIKVVSW